jgi:hypothetical protein
MVMDEGTGHERYFTNEANGFTEVNRDGEEEEDDTSDA